MKIYFCGVSTVKLGSKESLDSSEQLGDCELYINDWRQTFCFYIINSLPGSELLATCEIYRTLKSPLGQGLQ